MGRRGTVLAPIDARTLASFTSSASSWNEVRLFSPLSIAIRELLICFRGSVGIRLVSTDKPGGTLTCGYGPKRRPMHNEAVRSAIAEPAIPNADKISWQTGAIESESSARRKEISMDEPPTETQEQVIGAL